MKAELKKGLSSRTAKPIRDRVPHMRKEVPALRYASVVMTSFGVGCIYNWVSSRTAVADPGPCAARARGGPRSALRFGGDDIV
ncbi:hypothetical protein PbB2_01112 [Candidatus Phycosocius bacilliformis]|uniref:Uncharacterized protein n=1 Tax=Candidatus Phycosocius bacilliformis TaxID=1445552 RepID=A0A2P2E8R0_9PROT|nr:hypothetical protein PbB2_01112 [Candidatus Phycosocius bacilliformis]